MNRTFITALLFGLLMSANAHSQNIMASLDDGGFIVLSGENTELLGVDLFSDEGLLVPIPDNNASPFGFLLQNTANAITFGSLQEPVVVDGSITLGARYTGDINGTDLVGTWGGVEDGPPIPIKFPTAPPVDPDPVDPDPVDPDPVDPDPVDPPNGGGGTNPDPVDPPTDPVIPEPSSGLLAFLGFLCAGALRRTRKA